MELFDVLDSLFSRNRYKEVSNSDKRKYFFMIQRFMSIQYPVLANNMNIVNVNEELVVDMWHNEMVSRYVKKPQWMYTKSSVKKDKDKDAYDDDVISKYLELNEISFRDYKFAMEVIPEAINDDLKLIKTNLKYEKDN
jgi:hypothetical protein